MEHNRCYPRDLRRLLLPLVLMGAAIGLVADPETDYKIDRGLMSRLADDAEATAPFFVVFGERPNLAPAHRMADRAGRGTFVIQALQAVANRSQAGVRGYLRGRGVDFTPFWIENKIYVRGGTLELARALARRPEVVALLPEVVYSVPTPLGGAIQAVGSNIAQIRADQAWPITKGAGLVVANIDTGVQYNHPALVNQYRGRVGMGFSHFGNWWDPSGKCATAPCDTNGHGTHTMGTMVGDDGGANQIGVAPQAKWIACRGCTLGSSCLDSELKACAQWILDPNGDGNAADRADVVNNSWGGGGGDSWYVSYVQNWRAAGVFPAFSNGNTGPNCGTAGSPGDYPESFASGATDVLDVIAGFSSRGPSAFGGIKPNLSAPGVSVRSSYPTNTYAYGSGTSMASPHTAGTVALVWAAAPAHRGNISGTEQILKDSALPLTTTQTCAGVPGSVVPNNTYGWGRLDAYHAVQDAGGPVNQPPTVTITAPPNGSSYACPAAVNFTGTASDLEDGDLTASIVWTEGAVQFGTGGAAAKSYGCTETGNHNITARVTDSTGATDTDTITITIVNASIPAAPTNLAATVSAAVVTLTWKDNSDNEWGFKVERKPKGGAWSTTGTTAANVTISTDNPGKGNWQYRVRAYNTSGDSAPSNVVSARVK